MYNSKFVSETRSSCSEERQPWKRTKCSSKGQHSRYIMELEVRFSAIDSSVPFISLESSGTPSIHKHSVDVIGQNNTTMYALEDL